MKNQLYTGTLNLEEAQLVLWTTIYRNKGQINHGSLRGTGTQSRYISELKCIAVRRDVLPIPSCNKVWFWYHENSRESRNTLGKRKFAALGHL